MTLTDKPDFLLPQLPLAYGVSGALTSPLMRDREVLNLLKQAYDGGVRVFDTSPSYGAGRGEVLLGKAFESSADMLVMTKAGLRSKAFMPPERDFSTHNIIQSIEASLRRLGRRRIDVLWLHGPNKAELTDELLGVLGALKQNGDVGQFGIAGRGDELLLVNEYPLFTAAMMPINAQSTPNHLARASAIREQGNRVLAIEVLSGQMLGRHASRGQLWRMAKRLAGRGAVSSLKVASKKMVDISEVLRWPIQHGFADAVVSTTTRAAHLDVNIKAVSTL